MMPAPIPADDAERLRALRELLILDTPPEERFDRIVAFAAEEFEVPIALVSLVDEQRQWFKARVGMGVCETSREISFCAHAIVQPDLFEVLDATRDPRFADNPMVVGEPFIRFYLGAPLRLPGGATVGTLCLIDTRPREFDALSHAILGTLRDLVLAELTGEGAKENEDEAMPGRQAPRPMGACCWSSPSSCSGERCPSWRASSAWRRCRRPPVRR